MRRNGTRPKADKPKDHEPEVQATGIRSVLPRFRAQGQSGIASAQQLGYATAFGSAWHGSSLYGTQIRHFRLRRFTWSGNQRTDRRREREPAGWPL